MKTLWLSVLRAAIFVLLVPSPCRSLPVATQEGLGKRAKATPGPEPVEKVWRGEHGRSPKDVEKAGGIFSRGLERIKNGEMLSAEQMEKGSSLFWHAGGETREYTHFVSTSSEPGVGVNFAVDHQNLDAVGYLYRIHADKKVVDLEESLGKYFGFRGQKEQSVVGFVPFDQIEGWYEIRGRALDDILDASNRIKPTAEFHPNPKLNSAYNDKRSSGAKPQLAGFPQESAALKEKPWKRYAGKSAANLLGNFVWHEICSDDMDYFKQLRPKDTQPPPAIEPQSPESPRPSQEPAEDQPVSPEESVGLADAADFIPGKSLVDIAKAIASDEPVSLGDWLYMGTAVLIDVASIVPTPAAPVALAMKAGRATLRASKIIAKGIKAGKKVAAKTPQRVQPVLDVMIDTTKKADEALNSVKIHPVKGGLGTTSVHDVLKAADEVKLPSGTKPSMTQEELKELANKIDGLPSVPTGLIGEQMREAAKKAGIETKEALLAGRDAAAPSADKQKIIDDANKFAEVQNSKEKAPLDLLDRLVDILDSKVAHALKEPQPDNKVSSFLDQDSLLVALSEQFEIINIDSAPVFPVEALGEALGSPF